jgi:hypothetical protein
MPINIDAAAMEARFGNKAGTAPQPVPMQDLYAPGVHPEASPGVQAGAMPGTKQGQIPTGIPVPEGKIIQQVVGRGQPAMMVVPPKQLDAGSPSMAVIPPTGSVRTSIGTYVEVSQTKSNPLVDARPEINSGIKEEPVLQDLDLAKPRRQLDLTQAILDHIFELGGEKSEVCQKFYDRSPQTLRNWCQNPATIPLGAILKFLQKAPEIQDDIIQILEPDFSYNGNGGVTSLPNKGKLDMMLLSPVLERPTLPWTAFLVNSAKKFEMGYSWQADTMVDRSRNVLADRFLKSGCKWSLWIDGDMGAPIGKADYFRWLTNSETVNNEVASYDAVERLLGHRKACVGAVYASRRYHGQLVIQPEIHPRSHEDKLLANQIRRGQGQGLAGVEWIGFGCCLVHREVFLEVQRRFPDLAPQSELDVWDFFRHQGLQGEDEGFCQRVRACSIPIWLDTQLVCGHQGSMMFLPEHTRSQMAI